MKKILSGLFMIGAFGFATSQTISFDKTTFEYGTIKAGSDGHRYFTVKNTGDKPLILSEIKAACGCTTPEWSKDPILPGKSTQIKVGYNTGLQGPFNKLIEVYSNDPENSRSVLYIKGVVEPLNNGATATVSQPSKIKASEKTLTVEKLDNSKKVKKTKQ